MTHITLWVLACESEHFLRDTKARWTKCNCYLQTPRGQPSTPASHLPGSAADEERDEDTVLLVCRTRLSHAYRACGPSEVQVLPCGRKVVDNTVDRTDNLLIAAGQRKDEGFEALANCVALRGSTCNQMSHLPSFSTSPCSISIRLPTANTVYQRTLRDFPDFPRTLLRTFEAQAKRYAELAPFGPPSPATKYEHDQLAIILGQGVESVNRLGLRERISGHCCWTLARGSRVMLTDVEGGIAVPG